jgi:hypothetical protein
VASRPDKDLFEGGPHAPATGKNALLLRLVRPAPTLEETRCRHLKEILGRKNGIVAGKDGAADSRSPVGASRAREKPGIKYITER